MLGAIVKEVAKGAAAAADKVTDILPGKGGSDKDAADRDDVRQDQDQGELAPAGEADQHNTSADEQQGSEEPMISGDLKIDAPSSKNAVEDEPSATTAEAAGEAPPANESDDTPAVNDEQVNMPTPASGTIDQDDSKLLQEPVVVDTDSKDTATKDTPSKDKPSKDTASKKGDTAKTSPGTQQQTEPADQGAAAKQKIDNPQLTEGSKPLPKMAKGRSKWMKNSSAWYPDSAGILHAPGVYINKRKPFRGWGDAPTYKDIGEYLGIQQKTA